MTKITITIEGDTTNWDWVPDENHLTYEIGGLNSANGINILDKNVFIHPVQQKKYQYFLKGRK